MAKTWSSKCCILLRNERKSPFEPIFLHPSKLRQKCFQPHLFFDYVRVFFTWRCPLALSTSLFRRQLNTSNICFLWQAQRQKKERPSLPRRRCCCVWERESSSRGKWEPTCCCARGECRFDGLLICPERGLDRSQMICVMAFCLIEKQWRIWSDEYKRA